MLKNKILNGSGTLGYGIGVEKFFDIDLLGALVIKSTTINERKGNKLPHIYYGKNFVINSVGLKNPGIEKVIKIILPKLIQKHPNINIIASIWANNISDYCYLAEKFSKVKNVIAIEVNISCPNVQKDINFQNNFEMLSKLAISLKTSILNQHLIFKLQPDDNILQASICLEKEGIEYVTIANTYSIKYMVNNKPVVGNIYGGMSGPKIKNKTLELVKIIKNNTNLNIIGSGGIYSVNDAVEYFNLGVFAVQIGSANLKDLNIISNISKHFSDKN